jgi:hypothetical protein
MGLQLTWPPANASYRPDGVPQTLSLPLNWRDVYTVTLGTKAVWGSTVSIDPYSGNPFTSSREIETLPP